ncbi:L-aminoadipate-semialdehyde dehydrogenase-phosphopantetheinyl transferase-like isoform X2 [Vigna unguiculata]|uniref:L-aminoadipate-semialdehyde dehydrogenase-phosphopantetheinyl transferase-like isoform X2 n=1 Tax=Vigna unguiculata TaxID=3917 RepID=UPI001015EB40|nr:L-aminoadipate-semialdehyde dehydrogenase-phosphopantetheinyl transferase-like isoform X2 [Vigna unguiculata]
MGGEIIRVGSTPLSLLLRSLPTSVPRTLLCYQDYDGLRFPNFNFNVSHHGDYVAIASEPVCLVGVDIVSYDVPQRETITGFIQLFSSYFSCLEWNNIVSAGTSDDDVLIEFYRYWSLKEAYVKAIGSGLTEGLNEVEFSHTSWTNISAKVNGKVMTQWRFWMFELGDRHCVSIARVHPISAATNYKRTLKKLDFTEDEYAQGLHLPTVDFVQLGIEQLISTLQKA